MKKRNIRTFISLVVAVLIVCSLSAAAMAGFDTVMITVKSGETLSEICARCGVDFPNNKEFIMYLNGFTDPRQLDRIDAGDNLVLPAASDDVGFGMTDGASGPVPIVAGDASKAVMGDKVAYYVVLYTVRPGDILNNLYHQWNSYFGPFQMDMIRLLNGINNLDRLVVDKMLYLPVSRNDIAGMAHYTILEHTITYGENVGWLCRNYGIDFETAYPSLRCFNPYTDFAKVGAGDKLYIPVIGNLPAAGMTSAADAATGMTPASAAAMGMSGPVTAITSNTVVDLSTVLPGMMPAAGEAEETFDPLTGFTLNSAVDTAFAPAGTASSFGVLRGDPGLLPADVVYDGYAVVMDCSGALTLRLETADMDVSVAFTPQTIQSYYPRPGDYVKVSFTPTDFLLISIQYCYNVFPGAN